MTILPMVDTGVTFYLSRRRFAIGPAVNEGLKIRRNRQISGFAEIRVTAGGLAAGRSRWRGASMRARPDNVVPFPHSRRRDLRCCPHCGTHSNVWQIGRLLWGYCDVHEVRWVVADLQQLPPQAMDRQQLRRGLEFLSSFVEISRV